MRPGRIIRRTLLAGTVVAVTLLGAAAPALAAPSIAIEAPAGGSVTNDRTPVVAGKSSDSVDPVTVTVSREGSTVASMEALPQALGGEWEAEVPTTLGDGSYVLVATQSELATGESGESLPVGFTVHAAKPVVTLDAISSPANDPTPVFSGTASEEGPVTVLVYAAGDVGGTVLAEATAAGTGGGWSSSAASPALADGTYTAVAEQQSAFGNGPGRSQEQTFTVDTKPSVTLDEIPSPSGDTSPSFTGTASDTTTVTIHVFKAGSEVTTATASGTGGAWSSGPVAAALGDGTYTAVATQESSHGTSTGESGQISFRVVASPPHVTLGPVAALSNDTTPTFTGTASDTNPVTIRIFSGETEVAKAEATGTGGAWTSGQASPALAEGLHEYRAVAEQESSFGKGPGSSEERTFTVDTRSPVVSLEPVPTPSKDATPVFSGEASDSTPVVVHVFDAGNNEVASAGGTPAGGKWTSGEISKALPSGSYTARAEQASSLGNAPGHSANVNFTVDTEAPHVTLTAPAARSSNTTPSFEGTASDETEPIVVSVYKGTTATGTPVASATAAGTGGAWTSGVVSKALETGIYTARAVQKSSLGNPDGVSESRTFEVDTRSPEVTLEAPLSPSNHTTPSFKGTASDEIEPIVVSVFKGASASGTPVATLTAAAIGGEWSSGTVSEALEPGTYTARAAQKSSLGNPEGLSEARTFVIDTSPPEVKLEPVATLSNNTAPTFTGTASDQSEPIVVSVFKGASASGTPVAEATAAATGGAWSSGTVSKALESGTYTARAAQKSSLGNPEGLSEARTFRINTSPPSVRLDVPPARTNSITPTFSGTVEDEEVKVEPVTVHIREAGKSSDVATATANVTSGKWTTSAPTPALAKGDTHYEAFATQPSSLGNGPGTSSAVPFEVDTEPPEVTLNQIATPSNKTAPTFTGTASEAGAVTVEIVGGKAPIKLAPATVANGQWTATFAPGPSLPAVKAEYVATATQPSSIGNPAGKSKSIRFIVDPTAPNVVMSPVKAQIDSSTPTFTGTAGELPVTVAICKITTPCAAEQGEWTAKSAGGGAWSATLETAIPDGQYQAIASERNRAATLGATERQVFTVDTVPPALTITAPAQGATVIGGSVTAQGGAGTAPHDTKEVTVALFEGASIAPGQSPAKAVTVGIAGGVWSATFGGLSPGAYTVRASQSDEAGNVGTTARSFLVPAPAKAASGPSASFTWYPAHPHVGETVTLVSTSSDAAYPLAGYAWNLLGSAFASGAQTQTTRFSTPGNHAVGLLVTDAGGLSGETSQQIPVSLPLMRPFPVVRIVTTRSAGRVRLKLLSVEAPVGAIVTVSCTGKGCPVRSLSRLVPRPKASSAGTPALSFARFQRAMPAGTALDIRIAAAGQIGKFTRFSIRKGKLPLRSDACLNATEPRPVPCST